MVIEKLNNPNTTIIIGRGHSGTRILPKSLQDSGFYLGEPLNEALDLLPKPDIYQACNIFGPYVDQVDNYNWNFDRAVKAQIPSLFLELLTRYLDPLIRSDRKHIAWKIPQSNLIYPWLVRLFPKANFIHWVRHPETACSKLSGIDRLENWNIPAKKFLFHSFNTKMRVISWKYHADIVMNSPKPQNLLRVRLEDCQEDPEHWTQVLGEFLKAQLEIPTIDRKRAGVSTNKYFNKYIFLRETMSNLNYS